MYVLYYLLLIIFFLYYYTSYAFLEWCTIRRDDCKRDLLVPGSNPKNR